MLHICYLIWKEILGILRCAIVFKKYFNFDFHFEISNWHQNISFGVWECKVRFIFFFRLEFWDSMILVFGKVIIFWANSSLAEDVCSSNSGNISWVLYPFIFSLCGLFQKLGCGLTEMLPTGSCVEPLVTWSPDVITIWRASWIFRRWGVVGGCHRWWWLWWRTLPGPLSSSLCLFARSQCCGVLPTSMGLTTGQSKCFPPWVCIRYLSRVIRWINTEKRHLILIALYGMYLFVHI